MKIQQSFSKFHKLVICFILKNLVIMTKLLYWDLPNEHTTSGGRKFYYDKGK